MSLEALLQHFDDVMALWVWRWLGAGRDGRSIFGRLAPLFPANEPAFSETNSATTRTRHRPRRRQGGKHSPVARPALPLPPVNMIFFGILSSTFCLGDQHVYCLAQSII